MTYIGLGISAIQVIIGITIGVMAERRKIAEGEDQWILRLSYLAIFFTGLTSLVATS